MKNYQDQERHYTKGENNKESMKMIFKNSKQERTRSNPYKLKVKQVIFSNLWPKWKIPRLSIIFSWVMRLVDPNKNGKIQTCFEGEYDQVLAYVTLVEIELTL